VVGLMSVGATGHIESPVRRRFYGRAGEFRTPVHGLEYRTLSSTTLLSSPAVWHLFVEMARLAVAMGANGMRGLLDGSETAIRDIINNLDQKAARKLLRKNEPVLRGMIELIFPPSTYGVAGAANHMMKIVLEGIDSVMKDPGDVVGNWRLGTELFKLEPYGYVGDHNRSYTQWQQHSEGWGCGWKNACQLLNQGKML
jgi:hypothetical protein